MIGALGTDMEIKTKSKAETDRNLKWNLLINGNVCNVHARIFKIGFSLILSHEHFHQDSLGNAAWHPCQPQSHPAIQLPLPGKKSGRRLITGGLDNEGFVQYITLQPIKIQNKP